MRGVTIDGHNPDHPVPGKKLRKGLPLTVKPGQEAHLGVTVMGE